MYSTNEWKFCELVKHLWNSLSHFRYISMLTKFLMPPEVFPQKNTQITQSWDKQQLNDISFSLMMIAQLQPAIKYYVGAKFYSTQNIRKIHCA